jgi:2-dehydro-3-deoxyphosphogluconate aldolase/(4S)-4-hydroxy-2-oxoglutarate aldolase
MTDRARVADCLRQAPIIGVVRTRSFDEAVSQAESFIAGGIQLVEITFTVPNGPELVRRLKAERSGEAPPCIGMGTVTTDARARQALEAGAEFIVSPNAHAGVAAVANEADVFLVVGALTPTEIAAGHQMGADIIKVYPLPPVGGSGYLATVRQPLGDIPMLAAGGFGPDEIPDYRAAGAQAFGIGAPLLGSTAEESRDKIQRALGLARGDSA